MDWTELTIPNPPPTENVEFDRWLNNLTKHLRNYLGGLILNDDIANDAGDTAAWDFELGTCRFPVSLRWGCKKPREQTIERDGKVSDTQP